MTAAQTAAGTGTAARRAAAEPFDFRSPGGIARDQVRRLELIHEVFARAFGNELSSSLRTVIRVELMSIDQITYDEYVRSAPNPTVLCGFTIPPLAGPAIMEMSTQTGLNLVDRLLGGIGKSVEVRRPTALETSLLLDVFGLAVAPIRSTFEPILDVEPHIEGIEYNPHFVQAANPSDMVTVLSFSLAVVQGERSESLFTVCYPHSLLEAIEAHVDATAPSGPPALGAGAVAVPHGHWVADVEVPLSVRLRPVAITAHELRQIRPGDVLRLDHGVDEPVLGMVADSKLLEGRLGQKGKNLALELTNWSNR